MVKVLSLSAVALTFATLANSNVIYGSNNDIFGQNNVNIGYNTNIEGSNNWIVGVGHDVTASGIKMFGPDANPYFYAASPTYTTTSTFPTTPSITTSNAINILSNLQAQLQANAASSWGW